MALAHKRWVINRIDEIVPRQNLRRLVGRDAFDWRVFDFGFSLVGYGVTVNSGYVFIGGSVLEIPETTLEIQSGIAYIYCIVPRLGSPHIAYSHDISDTVSGGDDFKKLLYSFDVSDAGTITLHRVHHIGAIDAGNYWI